MFIWGSPLIHSDTMLNDFWPGVWWDMLERVICEVFLVPFNERRNCPLPQPASKLYEPMDDLWSVVTLEVCVAIIPNVSVWNTLTTLQVYPPGHSTHGKKKCWLIMICWYFLGYPIFKRTHDWIPNSDLLTVLNCSRWMWTQEYSIRLSDNTRAGFMAARALGLDLYVTMVWRL